MKRTFYLFIISILFFAIRAAAQGGEPVHIGIIPFDVIDYNAGTNARLVEDQVSSCFVNKGRFILIDRGVTEKLKAELEQAKDNTSLYAKIVADQGHMAGAQYLITGKVGAMNVSYTTAKNYLGTGNTTTYHGTMHVTLQINSVETGQVMQTYPFTITSNELTTSSNSDILDNVLCKFKSEFRIKVRSLFASEMAIVKIEKERNGIPQEVLINAGKETFEDGRNSNCGGASTLGALFQSKKIFLDVFAIEELNLGATTSKREKKIGELKVESVEGEVTVCKVTKGDKEIKNMLDNKKTMSIRMQ
jgi:hypothetical protein